MNISRKLYISAYAARRRRAADRRRRIGIFVAMGLEACFDTLNQRGVPGMAAFTRSKAIRRWRSASTGTC